MGPPKWTGTSLLGLNLYRPAVIWSRLDFFPFIALYFVSAGFVKVYNLSQFFATALIVTIVILHILAFLSQHWSVRARAFMSWKRDDDILSKDIRLRNIHALCTPREHRGKAELVPLQIDDRDRIYFIFQKRTYEYAHDANTFEKVSYPTHLPLRHYMSQARSTNGLSGDHLPHMLTRFGSNKLEMPAPTFLELYKQALLAPFFVFQVFCIFLWLLDEYWKYSLLTLVMMLIFEATVVHGRLRSLNELRGMRNPALSIYAYRNKKWALITSLDLLPGDIASVRRSRNASEAVPCDLLILSGNAVVNEAMLTGESVPLMKESVSSLEESDLDLPLSLKDVHKNHVLFGGTRVLTHSPPMVTTSTPTVKPPDGGCVCYVLRTGFGTSQGKLMRTILFSTESVSANSSEAAAFISFLLFFAVAASGYVLYHRYTEESDGRYKLLLRCVLIVTSVVPPELPMQLALAVNTSLIALVKNLVFCTEPFRIPYAGKIDVCCFDKTGTLTTDSINAVGVVMPSQGEQEHPVDLEGDDYAMVPVHQSSVDAALVLASCHSLVYIENELIGDPLELAALDAVQWKYGRTETCVPKRGGASHASAEILKRFRFASALQRMSVIANISGNAPRPGPRVLVKGSPEAVGSLLKGGTPEEYLTTARRLSRAGMRVLSLAYKDFGPEMTMTQASKLSREEAECNLTFAGFVCFECPLRNDSRKVVRMLRKANHMVMMITGDSTLTAAHVGTQVSLCTRRILILNFSEVNAGAFEWFSASSGKRLKRFTVETIEHLAREFDLCVGGPVLHAALSKHESMGSKLQHIKVFARMSPEQKEGVLLSLKESGLTTLMCGDGTNDVGALKQAHVGVALLSSATKADYTTHGSVNGDARARVIGSAQGQNRGKTEPGSQLRQRKNARKPGTTSNASSERAQRRQPDATVDSRKQMYAKKVQNMTANLGEADDQPPLVKLGDASIASPFTSRRMTIDSCVSIIRQGRCTLATTLQMYQILALNCLISAYSLSVLYLEGVMLGDKQMTIIGFVLAIASLMVSRSKPIKKLSPERPASSVFAPALFFSMMGQFAVHVTALIMCMRIVRPYVPPDYVPKIDEEFSPSLLNSVVFLLSVAQQISVYVLNYKGRPHMQGIFENRALLHSILIAGGLLIVCTLELSADLNEFMELVPWPSSELQIRVGAVIMFDLIGSFIADKFFSLCFTSRRTVVK